MDNAQEVLDSGDSASLDTCVTNTITQWTEKLGNPDAFVVDHYTAMI